jgi:hypothetical protein
VQIEVGGGADVGEGQAGEVEADDRHAVLSAAGADGQFRHRAGRVDPAGAEGGLGRLLTDAGVCGGVEEDAAVAVGRREPRRSRQNETPTDFHRPR